MSAIDSRIWNSFLKNLSSSKVFIREIVLLSLILVVVFSIFYDVTLNTFLFAIGVMLIFDMITLNFIGYKRRTELNKIISIINSIRLNQYKSADEIVLGKNLLALQEDIKSMFLRTQNDIENLKKLEQVRTEFLGNVSHELRTPIFTIQGYIETLLDGALNDAKVNKTFLEKANTHVVNLNNLLNDLIDISMIESGKMQMSYRYFNIKEYLSTIVNEFLPEAKKKNLELILHPIKSNLELFGDKNRLKQAFVNLIQNAMKYTEKGSIDIVVEEEEKFAKIIIRDSGIGIPANDLPRIFERFYRVDKVRSKSVGGTGLGLAIVKHIVEAHGSKVMVNSVLGKGSEFSFKLKK